MRHVTRRLFIGGAAMLPAAPALAQAYPDRPVRLIAPFAAGGASDLIARLLAEAIAPALGQPMVVENRTGAGGAIGTEAVVRARPDGYTLLMGSQATHSTNPALTRLAYDPGTDLVPVAPVAGVPGVLVVGPGSTARDLSEFLAQARANPGNVAYGSAGIGASTHLTMALLESMARAPMQHVPYRGTGPAMQDLLAGRIAALFDTLPTSLPYIRDGRLRALAVSTAQRSAALPDVPTVAEAGVTGYEALNWYAVFAPRGTPEPVIATLNAAITRTTGTAEFRRRLSDLGMESFDPERAALTQYIADDRRRWTELVRSANITAN